jgi:hypothetical protein
MKRFGIWMAVAAMAACGKKAADKPAPKMANGKVPVASSAAASQAAPAEPPVAVNPDVKKMVDDVVANCKVDADSGSVGDCKNGELDAPGKYVTDKTPADFYVSIAEIVVTDGAKDKSKMVAALAVANSVGWGPGKDWLQKNATPAAAKRYLKIVDTAPDSVASMIGGFGAAIPIYGGMQKDLDALLAKKPAGSLKTDILNYYVTYAGVAALPSLDAMLKASTDEGDRSAAVWSAGVALAQPWNSAGATFSPSDADKPKICDWAKGYLADAMPRVSSSAASSMGRCGGAYIDAALDALGKRAEKDKVDDGLTGALKDQCWAESSINPVNGTVDQCKKDLSILEKMSARADLDTEGLRSTLWAMSTVGKYGCGKGYGSTVRDAGCVKQAKEALSKFSSNKEKSIADAVKDDLKDL